MNNHFSNHGQINYSDKLDSIISLLTEIRDTLKKKDKE